jgi:ribosomal protein S18 acetylase RimI-like enzyme
MGSHKTRRKMSIVLRPAEPRDAEFLGWACVAASRSQLPCGWFDIVLERNEAFILEFAKYLVLAKARSWWHWSLFYVAEVDDEVASAMCGFGDGSVYQVSAAAMAEASDRMGIDSREQAQHWPRGSFVMSTVTSERPAWTIENVATSPEFRRTGLTQALLGKQLDLARAAGFKRAQISVFIGNTPAEAAYTKAGFSFVEEKRSPEFEKAMGIPGMRRLARDI